MRGYTYPGSGLLPRIESGTVQYYHPDQLSVRLMTHSTRPPRRTRSGQADSGGNVIGRQGHYPFGEPWYQTNTTTKWFFTAGVYPERSRRERNAESGNDYASFRYDVNRLGRFSQPDLLAGSIADPQSLDRYPYVRGDPVNLVDPLGLTDCDPATQGQYAGCEPGDQTNGVPDSGVIFLSSVDLCISCVYGVLGATAALAPVFDLGTLGGEWGGQDPFHGGGGGGGVEKALKTLRDLLKLDKKCLDFLNSQSSKKGDVLGNIGAILQFGLFGATAIPPTQGPGGSAVVVNAYSNGYIPGQSITVNSEGAFFNSTYGGAPLTTDRGRIRGGTDAAQGFILLHELGHVQGALVPDTGKQGLVDRNDKTLESKCKDTVDALRQGQ